MTYFPVLGNLLVQGNSKHSCPLKNKLFTIGLKQLTLVAGVRRDTRLGS